DEVIIDRFTGGEGVVPLVVDDLCGAGGRGKRQRGEQSGHHDSKGGAATPGAAKQGDWQDAESGHGPSLNHLAHISPSFPKCSFKDHDHEDVSLAQTDLIELVVERLDHAGPECVKG